MRTFRILAPNGPPVKQSKKANPNLRILSHTLKKAYFRSRRMVYET